VLPPVDDECREKTIFEPKAVNVVFL
jgi:hypothetical protein